MRERGAETDRGSSGLGGGGGGGGVRKMSTYPGDRLMEQCLELMSLTIVGRMMVLQEPQPGRSSGDSPPAPANRGREEIKSEKERGSCCNLNPSTSLENPNNLF